MSDASSKAWEHSDTLKAESPCGVTWWCCCRRWAVPLKITLTKQATWQARNGRKASKALPRPRTRAATSSSRCLPINLLSVFSNYDENFAARAPTHRHICKYICGKWIQSFTFSNKTSPFVITTNTHKIKESLPLIFHNNKRCGPREFHTRNLKRVGIHCGPI